MGRGSTKKSLKRKRSDSSITQKNWADQDADVLREIFARVPKLDLFFRVSRVCKWWRYACSDLFSWNCKDVRTLDLGDVKDILGGYSPHEGIKDYNDDFVIDLKRKQRRSNEYEGRVFRGLNYVLNHSFCKDSLEFVSELILPPHLYVTCYNLIHLSNRLPNLKRLTVLGIQKVTYYGFKESTLSNWKKLEYVSLGRISSSQVIIVTVSMIRNCCNLKTLHLHGIGPWDFMMTDRRINLILDKKTSRILKGMQHVQYLMIKGAILYKYSLGIILAGCKQLQQLNLVECFELCSAENNDLSFEDLSLEDLSPLSLDIHKNGEKWYVDGKEDQVYNASEFL